MQVNVGSGTRGNERKNNSKATKDQKIPNRNNPLQHNRTFKNNQGRFYNSLINGSYLVRNFKMLTGLLNSKKNSREKRNRLELQQQKT